MEYSSLSLGCRGDLLATTTSENNVGIYKKLGANTHDFRNCNISHLPHFHGPEIVGVRK